MNAVHLLGPLVLLSEIVNAAYDYESYYPGILSLSLAQIEFDMLTRLVFRLQDVINYRLLIMLIM
jgi:hypothetical protein